MHVKQVLISVWFGEGLRAGRRGEVPAMGYDETET
jgi:hypothetical protein